MLMKVHDLMTRDFVTAQAHWPLATAVGVMAERSVRHLPVMERGELVGLVSERDLLEATGWTPERYVEADRGPKLVRDYMSVPVETVHDDDDVTTALSILLDRRRGCLPVLDAEERLVGILTVSDLVTELVRASGISDGVGELDGVVAGWMKETPETVEPTATVNEALALCRRHTIRHLPVVSDGWLVGFVSDRDLRLRLGRGETERTVADIMSTSLVSVGPESLLSDAAELMQARRMDSIAVTTEGRLVGVLTTTDVLAFLQERLGVPSGV